MASVMDFPARGKVIGTRGDKIIFNPTNTNYELYLDGGASAAPTNVPVKAMIRAAARRLWTVPSGGNFIAPIFGPPRTVQGRVQLVDGNQLVVHAGMPIVVTLPTEDVALDLSSGAIGVGTLVNFVAMPGATIELLQPAAIKP